VVDGLIEESKEQLRLTSGCPESSQLLLEA
jgi:hypothetical protein